MTPALARRNLIFEVFVFMSGHIQFTNVIAGIRRCGNGGGVVGGTSVSSGGAET